MRIAFGLAAGLAFAVVALEIDRLRRFLAARRRGEPALRHLTREWALALHGVALAGLACGAWAFLIEPRWVALSRVRVASPRLRRASFRIVHVTDTHSEGRPLNEDRLAALINPLEPDLIVFTGDALNALEGAPVFRRAMAPLRARLGKFAVSGNWDEWFFADVDVLEGT